MNISPDTRLLQLLSQSFPNSESASTELINLYSNDLQVTSETPVCYLCWASDDDTVKPTNSLKYRSALKKAEVSVTAKTFSSGGHGFGFSTSFAYHNQMVKDLTKWLEGLDGILTAIDAINDGQLTADNAIYNLSGQRLGKLQKGINIVNGKKVLR